MLNEPRLNCHCGSEHSFQNCCEKFISGSQFPDSPEQLMRSRYSAYLLKDESYLLKSWHKSTRPELLDLKEDSTQWKALKIISSIENNVYFVAFFTQDSLNKDKTYALTEESHFIKDENNWFYLDGSDVKTVQLTKNMLCPCQSGKKYKRCCGA
jgi:SEC-C motif domain protein